MIGFRTYLPHIPDQTKGAEYAEDDYIYSGEGFSGVSCYPAGLPQYQDFYHQKNRLDPVHRQRAYCSLRFP